MSKRYKKRVHRNDKKNLPWDCKKVSWVALFPTTANWVPINFGMLEKHICQKITFKIEIVNKTVKLLLSIWCTCSVKLKFWLVCLVINYFHVCQFTVYWLRPAFYRKIFVVILLKTVLCPKLYRGMARIGFSDLYSMLRGTMHRDCTQNVYI